MIRTSVLGSTLLIVAMTISTSLYGDVKIGKDLNLDTRIYFNTDETYDKLYDDYFSLGAELQLEYEPTDNWEFRIEVDADITNVRLEKIWGQSKFERFTLRMGMFQNELLIEDLLSSTERLFATKGSVRTRIKDMGWYSSGAVGLMAYRNYKGEGLPLTAYTHLAYLPSASELQLDLAAFYPFAGENTYLGLLIAYYPFIFHESWAGSGTSSSKIHSYTEDHNVLINLVIADHSDKTRFLYKAETTLGNNLIDPVGYVHFPGSGEPTWFWGFESYLGLPVKKNTFVWTPAVDYSILIHQLNRPQSYSQVVRLGNKLAWNNMFYIHLDIGLGINTFYDPELVTELEELWAVKLQVQL